MAPLAIKVERLDQKQLQALKVLTWPIWEKEASEFDWFYEEEEKCLFLEGEVTVKTKQGEVVSFGKGDFVTFPKGLKCQWTIRKAVKKHYQFG